MGRAGDETILSRQVPTNNTATSNKSRSNALENELFDSPENMAKCAILG
jgi:hypothetical protein